MSRAERPTRGEAADETPPEEAVEEGATLVPLLLVALFFGPFFLCVLTDVLPGDPGPGARLAFGVAIPVFLSPLVALPLLLLLGALGLLEEKPNPLGRRRSPTGGPRGGATSPYRDRDRALRGTLFVLLLGLPASGLLVWSLYSMGQEAYDEATTAYVGAWFHAFVSGQILWRLSHGLARALVIPRSARVEIRKEQDREREEKLRDKGRKLEEKEREKRAEKAEQALEEEEAKRGLLLKDCDGRRRIRYDPKARSLHFLLEEKTVGPDELVGVEILDDQSTVQSTDRASQAAGALVGGVAFGTAGAVVGGLSGSTRSTGKCERLALKVILDDPERPTVVIDVARKPALKRTGWPRNGITYKSSLRTAQHWHGVISSLMHRATPAGASRAGETRDSTANELSELARLRQSGDLTDEEYARAKAKLLDR